MWCKSLLLALARQQILLIHLECWICVIVVKRRYNKLLTSYRVSRLIILSSSVFILFLSSSSFRAFEALTLWTQEEIYKLLNSLNMARIQRSKRRSCRIKKKKTRIREVAFKMRRYRSKLMRYLVKLNYNYSLKSMNNSLISRS